MTQTRITIWLAITLSTVLLLTTLIASLAVGAGSENASSQLPAALADIPSGILVHYQNSSARHKIDWAILAAIGKIESDHNRSQAPGVHSGLNFAACCAGMMQISTVGGANSTWGRYRTDGDQNGTTSIYEPADAIATAAAYLVASGAPADYPRAIYAYNHAQWYVDKVTQQAAEYRAIAVPLSAGNAVNVLVNPRITLTQMQRADISRGLIDSRIIQVLSMIGSSHAITISSLRSDHSLLTASGNVSNHASGRAVDISSVDNQPCTGTRTAPCGVLTVQLARLTGPLRSTELIYCFDPDGAASPDAFARPDHCDHIHIGFRHNRGVK